MTTIFLILAILFGLIELTSVINDRNSTVTKITALVVGLWLIIVPIIILIQMS